MNEQIKALQAEIDAFVISNEGELESFRNQFVGRKSRLASLFDELKNVPAENRREVGQALNGLKNSAETKFAEAQEAFAGNAADFEVPSDLTLYNPISQGSLHPLTKVRARILEIFNRMGFSVSDGPEIETDFYNFTALNFPANHPAREMQDTFFIEKGAGEIQDDVLLRTLLTFRFD
jgi:phenylalanyl-tRNA synthetase alpha chain